VLETLLPKAACAEMRADVPESTLFPDEAAIVANAVAARRREFATARFCARRTLRELGFPDVPIVPDDDRAPVWPAGVVGSITHCAGYRAAAAARSDDLSGLGIDAEPHAALPQETRGLVLRDEERARLRILSLADPDVHWDRVAFCAKEAIYKAWFPLNREPLDYADVATSLDPGGAFRGCLLVDSAAQEISGRWIARDGLVGAAAWVRP